MCMINECVSAKIEVDCTHERSLNSGVGQPGISKTGADDELDSEPVRVQILRSSVPKSQPRYPLSG